MALKKLRFQGRTYPNGVSKERLFNTFLNYRHFVCTQQEYDLDLETLVLEEQAGVRICSWFRDTDGELVVEFDRLQLSDPRVRVVMTETWFVFSKDPDPSPMVFVS